MSARVDAYLFARNRWRFAGAWALVGRCASALDGAPEPPPTSAQWAPVFDRLHELFKRDALLSADVIDVLAVVAVDQRAHAALMALYRFRRRVYGMPRFDQRFTL